MNVLIVLSALVAMTMGAPAPKEGCHPPPPEPTPAGNAILPFLPHVAGHAALPFYHHDGQILLAGSAFVEVAPTGCKKIALLDDMGGSCPMNQTTCDFIAGNMCPPAVANVTCFTPEQLAMPGAPTELPEPELPAHGPLGPPCYVEIDGRRYQPTPTGAIYMVSPVFKTCIFQVAPPKHGHGHGHEHGHEHGAHDQGTCPHPHPHPEPNPGPIFPADPPCPFLEG